MMNKSAHQMMIMFILLLCCLIESSGSSSGVGESKFMCKEAERDTLLKIAASLFGHFKFRYLPSWGEEEIKRECCEWIGIQCDNKSGHVVRLDLSHLTFDGDNHYDTLVRNNINFSSVQLEYLNYLDLSGIKLYGNSIPSFIGNLRKLRYLDLSYTSLNGQFYPHFGNLSSLRFLNLSNNGLGIKNFEWASRLSSLRVLDLSHTSMASASDWAHVISNIPNLVELRLFGCSLPRAFPSSLSLVNSSKFLSVLDLSQNSLSTSVFQWLFNYNHSLVYLDLSHCSLTSHPIPRAFESMASLEYLSLASNLFGGSLPKYLGNVTTLKHVDLSSNKLEGSIPDSFGKMANLEYLDLQNNTLDGEIPKSIWEICTLESLDASINNLTGHLNFPRSSSRCAHFSLEYLDLSRNQITGSLPNFTMFKSFKEIRLSSNHFIGKVSETIGQLSKLKVLDISENFFSGVMFEAHFSKLFSLSELDLSNNPSLVLNISSHWIPPFQLESIYLKSCKLGPRFPKWLQTQKHFLELDISNSQISDSVPDGFWNASNDFYFMNLSNNRISGTVQDKYFAMSSFKMIDLTIDLTSNQFEGSIPVFLFKVQDSHLSNNKFSSLSSLCYASDDSPLNLLDISNNRLEGDLPDCWSHFVNLRILVLTNNKLSGKIPDSIGSLYQIYMLQLGNNNFTGKLPLSLSNCVNLEILDLGENRLLGPIPTLIGELKFLIILNLRSNKLNGGLPPSLCGLVNIQLLDLSMNSFSGNIPSCVSSFLGMRKDGIVQEFMRGVTDIVIFYFSHTNYLYTAQVTIIWKGKLSQYKNTLRLVKSINLSNNKLVGNIPREVTELDGLVALNLSRNGVTGQIPAEIGHMRSLEVLDLSVNHLSGTIPSSLSELNFMNTLDISDNYLSGKIPTSTQLQSFDPSTYAGNPELCGDPLRKKCPGEEPTTFRFNEEDQDSFVTHGFYLSLGLGFVLGFWGICGSLVFIKSWRYAYYNFLNGIGDRIYIMIALHSAKLLRIIKH